MLLFRLPRGGGPPQAGGILTKLIHHRCMYGPPDLRLIVRSARYITHIDGYVHSDNIEFTICVDPVKNTTVMFC